MSNTAELAGTIKVVGMDPSLSNWGLAYATLDLDSLEFTVDSLELVCTEPEKDKKVRKMVRKNCEDLDRVKILQKAAVRACEDAFIAFVEVPVGSQSSRAMTSYGVCLGVLAGLPIPLIVVTPDEVKIAGAGVKTATKEEMIEFAMREHPGANWLMKKRGGKLVPLAKNEHLADAVAAIKAGIDTDQFQQLVSILRGRFSALLNG